MTFQEVFYVSLRQLIENIRTRTDIKIMSTEVDKKGSLLGSLERSDNFMKVAKNVTGTIITIPD